MIDELGWSYFHGYGEQLVCWHGRDCQGLTKQEGTMDVMVRASAFCHGMTPPI